MKRMSDSILLGSIHTKQAFGWYGRNGATCAIGSALAAEGHDLTKYTNEDIYMWEKQLWPWTWTKRAFNPAVPLYRRLFSRDRIRNIVDDLNEKYLWTRPRIAAWLHEQEDRIGVFEPTPHPTPAHRDEIVLDHDNCQNVVKVSS